MKLRTSQLPPRYELAGIKSQAARRGAALHDLRVLGGGLGTDGVTACGTSASM